MTLQEYKEQGGCEECPFYNNVEVNEIRMECTFPWFDEGAVEWEYSKNCDEL